MTQHEAVIDALRRNGGYATLGTLNQTVPVADWGTKTPFATIRRIVQQRPEIFKVRAGLWALEEARNHLPAEIQALMANAAPTPRVQELTHYFYQGLLLEIGKDAGYETYVPPQDKNKLFLDKPLGEVATLSEFPLFTYKAVLDKVESMDVVWFNKRGYPHSCYEVEHSTDITKSLNKYVELQDFCAHFYIVAHGARDRDFASKIDWQAAVAIKDRVEFLDYERLTDAHSKLGAASSHRQLFHL